MTHYICRPCGAVFDVSSGSTCYDCGGEMEKAYTEREVNSIVNTPTPAEIEEMFKRRTNDEENT